MYELPTKITVVNVNPAPDLNPKMERGTIQEIHSDLHSDQGWGTVKCASGTFRFRLYQLPSGWGANSAKGREVTVSLTKAGGVPMLVALSDPGQSIVRKETLLEKMKGVAAALVGADQSSTPINAEALDGFGICQ